MKDPTILYKSPGQHNGGKHAGKLRTFDSKPAAAEDVDRLLKEGWFKTMPEAFKAEDAEKANEKAKAPK